MDPGERARVSASVNPLLLLVWAWLRSIQAGDVTELTEVSDAAGLVGPHGDLDAVSGAELSHQTGEVGFNGAWGDVELAGDLVVGSSLGYRQEDLFLAGGERFHCRTAVARPLPARPERSPRSVAEARLPGSLIQASFRRVLVARDHRAMTIVKRDAVSPRYLK